MGVVCRYFRQYLISSASTPVSPEATQHYTGFAQPVAQSIYENLSLVKGWKDEFARFVNFR